MIKPIALALLLSWAAVGPAQAQYKLIPQSQPVVINGSALRVTPTISWNKLSVRAGKRAETWTLDGTALNDITFFTGIPDGKPMIREVNRTERPLPRFSKTMLPPDVAQLFEATYRIVLGTPRFTLDSIEPTPFAGHPGFRFTYSFALQGEEVRRKGEVNGAIINGLLYMISFEAPVIHYFGRDMPAYRSIVGSAFVAG